MRALFLCVRCIISFQKKKKRSPSRGYHQQQNKLLCQFPARELALKSTLETSPRIGILDSELPTSKVERSAVICVVGHGYPATVGVCIREESAWIQALVVHERLAMASRVRLVEAGTSITLRAERAGWCDAVIGSCSVESRVSRAMRRTGGVRVVVVVVCAGVMAAAG
jgi:hypothetical protein